MSEGIQAYASLALVGASGPLVSGQPYTVRATISAHPPQGYRGKPQALVGDLPQAPRAFLASPGLEEGIQGPSPCATMPVGRRPRPPSR